MNVKRFTAPTSHDALKQVRLAFGREAVVLSTRPCAEGVEVLAMAPDALHEFERLALPAPGSAGTAGGAGEPATARGRASQTQGAWGRTATALRQRLEPTLGGGRSDAPTSQLVEEDVQRLSMSTLSFQDYVRERLLRRRKQEMEATQRAASPAQALPAPGRGISGPSEHVEADTQAPAKPSAAQASLRPPAPSPNRKTAEAAPAKSMRLSDQSGSAQVGDPQVATAMTRERAEMVNELRSMKGLIEERFGALAFMEKLQRHPRQAQLTQKLLDCGFSPALTRKMVAGLPANKDELAWTTSVLERNLVTGEREAALEDQGGVWALVGSTGVGKTTSTAKLAAAFVARHGAGNLGLITLDAYRLGAQDQLRAYGRILGVPVHTAHDRASLEDLLELLAGKKMVLIDTAGIAQRDARTSELMDMLSHPSVQRLLVINAAAQGETIEDVVRAYSPAACKGVVLTKVDEAVKLGPALDPLIRHRMKVVAVANGQRVPEDWHRLSSGTLVRRALKAAVSQAWRMDSLDVNLVFAGAQVAVAAAAVQ